MVIATAAILAFLTACEPVGYSIEQEEKLSAATIRGNIHTMVPMGGNLYVQNGRIYTKAFDGTGDWKEMPRPTNARIVALASDDACLYAKDSDNNIWAAPNGSGWTKVHSGAGEVFLFDNGEFDANGDTTGRVAYFRAGNDVKKLDKTTDTASITPVSGNGAGANTKNCVSISGTDYFTDKSIVATFGNNIFAVESEARLDTSACKTIVYMDPTAGSPSWTSAGTTKYAVTGMAMGKDSNNNDVLLAGTLQNYEIWTITNYTPVSGSAASETSSTIGSHSILGIWEYAGIRYASIYNLKVSNYNGLWYRKASGKWDKA